MWVWLWLRCLSILSAASPSSYSVFFSNNRSMCVLLFYIYVCTFQIYALSLPPPPTMPLPLLCLLYKVFAEACNVWKTFCQKLHLRCYTQFFFVDVVVVVVGEKTISFCFSWIIIFVKVLLMNYGHCMRGCMWVLVSVSVYVEVGEGNALSEQFSDAKVNLLHSVSCYRENILKSFTIKHLITTEMKWGENYII